MGILKGLTKSIGVAALMLATLSSASAQDRTPLRIVFGAPPTTFELPHFVARDMGWFEKAGLQVEETFVAGDSNAVRGLVSGGAEGAGTNLMVAMQAITEGARIKLIGAWQPRVDYQTIAQNRVAAFKDLAGARIATASAGGITQKIPEMLMQKYRVDASGVKFISLGGHEARMKAVLTDKVDASVVGMLYAAQAQNTSKDIRILGSVADDFPGLGFTFLAVTDKDLADPTKRAALEKYVRVAIIEGSRFIVSNPDRAAEIMHKRSTETPVALIAQVIREMNRLKLWGVNGGVEPEVTEFTAKLGHEMGVLKRPLASGEGIDRSLVENALKQTGRI